MRKNAGDEIVVIVAANEIGTIAQRMMKIKEQVLQKTLRIQMKRLLCIVLLRGLMRTIQLIQRVQMPIARAQNHHATKHLIKKPPIQVLYHMYKTPWKIPIRPAHQKLLPLQ